MSSEADTNIDSSIPAVPTTSNAFVNSRILHVSKSDELEAVQTDSTQKVILIEFFADWCGPCNIIATKLEEWVQIYDVIIVKINVDEWEEIAIEYKVEGIPAFVVLKDKQKLDQFEGSNQERIISALEKFCTKFKDIRQQAISDSPEVANRQANREASETVTSGMVDKRRSN